MMMVFSNILIVLQDLYMRSGRRTSLDIIVQFEVKDV
jgi:hypothetical protein